MKKYMLTIVQPRKIEKFLEMYNLPGLSHEEVENVNRPITSNQIPPNKKKSSMKLLHQWILPDIYGRININPSQFLKKK